MILSAEYSKSSTSSSFLPEYDDEGCKCAVWEGILPACVEGEEAADPIMKLVYSLNQFFEKS